MSACSCTSLLYWSPRVLGILTATFLSLFALDALGPGIPWTQAILGLLIHLIPTYIVLGVLALAWRWEWIGALAFLALSLCYVVLSGGREHWTAYLAISGSLFAIGILFLAAWIVKIRNTRP